MRRITMCKCYISALYSYYMILEIMDLVTDVDFVHASRESGKMV